MDKKVIKYSFNTIRQARFDAEVDGRNCNEKYNISAWHDALVPNKTYLLVLGFLFSQLILLTSSIRRSL